MADFSIPQDTLLPILTATLTYDDGTPIDLTGATVKFQMRLPGSSTLKVDSAAVVVGAATLGQVSYTWVAADTDTPGLYVAWFSAVFGLSTLHAPNPSLVIEVTRGASGA